MSFKDELQVQYTEAQLARLKQDLQRATNSNMRYYHIPLEYGIDYTTKWFGPTIMIGHGKVMWDQLVQLGFQPKFHPGGGWAGGPHIYVKW